MTTITNQFPTREILMRGCTLASIVHAVAMTTYSVLAHEQSWDGPNYSVQDSAGTRGTLTFSENEMVAVFRDENRNRREAIEGSPADCKLFKGAPDTVINLAGSEALQYVLDTENGKVVPVITAAFWTVGSSATASEPWSNVVANGAHIIQRQCLPEAEALLEWQEDYELADELMDLASRLFHQRITQPHRPIELSESDTTLLSSHSESEEAFEEVRASMGELGIQLPQSGQINNAERQT